MEEKLILAVQNNPVLYDKNLSTYKSVNGRDYAWKEVAKELNLNNDSDIEGIKKRWRTLRDAFIKHYRAIKNEKSGSAGGKRKKWIYYDLMLFLVPFVEFKETIGSYSQKEDTQEERNDSFESENIIDILSTHTTSDTLSTQTSSDTLSTQPAPQNIVSTPMNTLNKRQSVVEQRNLGKSHTKEKIKQNTSTIMDAELMKVITKEDDPDEQFMLSCVPILKQLTPKKNVFARMQIQKLLYNLAYGDDNCDGRPSTSMSITSTPTPQPSPNLLFSPTNENSSTFTSLS